MKQLTDEEKAKADAEAAEKAKKEEEEKAKAAKAPKLVKMVREAEQWPAPHTADVHPDEVDNYRVGGWRVKGE